MFEFKVDGLVLSDKQVLSPLNVKIETGETHCLLGPSGSGKTTLLNLMAGLQKQNIKSVQRESGSCDTASHFSLWTPKTPEIGYLFQQPRLLPWRTVLQNLLLVEPNREIVIDFLKEVRLEEYIDYYPSRISLGMARRVALVRCLLLKPDLVLMDEPLTSLDLPTAREMRGLIKRLVCDHPTRSMIYVSHDLDEVLELGDRVSIIGGTPSRVIYENCIENVSRDQLEVLLEH
jgi:NitT/TauT family transport system ATP-binding protein